ncbi:MAG: preprotein translocase subunit SecG [bacterium]|nr:preprotein translocase subunit SecG [bacterium]MDW8087388.1 preprotein translocase subunit SecG [Candidatus Calescibacterium sp.]
MLIFLWVLEIIVGILLVLAVLMQVGRGETITSMFGGGAQSIFGPKGPATILEKITFGLIAAFFVITLGIAKISSTRTFAPPAPQLPPEIPASPEELLPINPKEQQNLPNQPQQQQIEIPQPLTQ